MRTFFQKNLKSSDFFYIIFVLLVVINFSVSVYARDPEPHQVILYEHGNYKGSYIVLSYDRDVNNISYWHTDSGKSWNDKISSIKVGKNTKVTLYEHKLSYKNGGAHITIQGNCKQNKNKSSLSSIGWNDRVTALKVRMADCYD
jgi:hypothetical protein